MVTPEIIAYVKSQLANGIGREAIVKALADQGWTLVDIDTAFTGGITSAPVATGATSPAGTAVKVRHFSFLKLFVWLFVIGFFAVTAFGLYLGYAILFNHNALSKLACPVIVASIKADNPSMTSKQKKELSLECPCVVDTMIRSITRGDDQKEMMLSLFSLTFKDFKNYQAVTGQGELPKSCQSLSI